MSPLKKGHSYFWGVRSRAHRTGRGWTVVGGLRKSGLVIPSDAAAVPAGGGERSEPRPRARRAAGREIPGPLEPGPKPGRRPPPRTNPDSRQRAAGREAADRCAGTSHLQGRVQAVDDIAPAAAVAAAPAAAPAAAGASGCFVGVD